MVFSRRILFLLLPNLIAISLGAHALRPLTDVRYEALARNSGVVLSDGSGFVVISGDRVFRIDSSGQVIDPVSRRIAVPPGSNSYRPPVGIWTGSSYLLVWQTSSGLTVSRLDRDGNPIGSDRTIVDGGIDRFGSPPSIVRAGENFVVVYRKEPGLYALRLDSGGERIGGEIELSPNFGVPDTAVSLGAVALVGSVERSTESSRWRAWEIEGSTGEIRVSPLEKIPSGSGHPQLIGTVSGAVLVWPDGTRLHTAAVDSSGTVTARHIIDLGTTEVLSFRGVSTSEGVFLLGRLYIPPVGYGPQATAVLNLDGSEKRGWIQTDSLFFETLASNGSRVIATGIDTSTTEERAEGVWILADGSQERFSFPPWPNGQSSPSIACTAEDCLVTWEEDAWDGTQSIRSARIDDRGRPVVGSERVLAPRGGSYPSVARSELESLVVWHATSSVWPWSIAIHARRVKHDGSATGPLIVVSDSPYDFIPMVASDGDSWLVVWIDRSGPGRSGLMARRVLRNGMMTDTVRVSGLPVGSYVSSVVWTGNEYAVVTGEVLPVCQTLCTPDDRSVWFASFSKSGQPIGEPKRLALGPHVGAPRIGISSAGVFVNWLDLGGARMSQIDGTGQLIGESVTLPGVGWGSGPITGDGTSFYFETAAATPSTWRFGYLGVLAATGDVSSIGFPVEGFGILASAGTGSLQFVIAEDEPHGVLRLVTFRQPLRDEGVDLHLAVEGIDAQIPADSQRMVTLTVSNQGSSTATDVVMNAYTGSGHAVIFDSDGGVCSAPYGELRCTWERLDAGAVRRVRVRFDFQLYGYYPVARRSSRVFHARTGAHESDARAADNILDLPYVVYRTPQKVRGVRR